MKANALMNESKHGRCNIDWMERLKHQKHGYSPDIDLQPVGHQELYSVHVSTQMQRRVPLIIRRQQIGPELVQEAADVHVPPGGS